MNRPHAAPDADPSRQWLSDLADGRLQGDPLAAACRDWAADAEARRTWHAYHLIGDVLRSDDLARPPTADADFMARLRSRLAEEPVVLAPAAPTVTTRVRRQFWLMPMAAAAGFVAVAGVVVVLQQAAPQGSGFASPQLAASPPPAGLRTVSTLAGTPAVLPAGVARGEMLRDARVDEYLRAHRDLLVGSPAALPGGGVRAVDFNTAPPR
jgi:sigma-E factor negative regulatory protein RseA